MIKLEDNDRVMCDDHRVMFIAMVFEEVVRVVCPCAPQSGKLMKE